MYGGEGEGYGVKAIGYTSPDYYFYDVDFLFHGGTAVFEEFALFLDFSCGGMCLGFPCEGGNHIDT